MNNYRKGKNVEEPLEKTGISIKGLPDDFLWMQVRGGSKIRNLISHALEEFPKTKHVVWTGFGTSVGKAVTCAEIMKREWDNKLHQITKVCYRVIEEYWDPLRPEMDQLVVKRKLPMIHIYLCIDPLSSEELGYQAPGETTPYSLAKNNFQDRKSTTIKIGNRRDHTLGEFVASKSEASTFNKKKSPKNKEKNPDFTGNQTTRMEESTETNKLSTPIQHEENKNVIDNINHSQIDLDLSSKSISQTNENLTTNASQDFSQDNKNLKKSHQKSSEDNSSGNPRPYGSKKFNKSQKFSKNSSNKNNFKNENR